MTHAEWITRLQQFAPAHNPTFPGYRRTLQPLPARRRIRWRWIAVPVAAVVVAVILQAM